MFDKFALKEMDRVGAILRNGHYLLAGGLHSDAYVNKDAVFARPKLIDRLCLELAIQCRHAAIDVVAGPVTGGAIMAAKIASCLNAWNDCDHEVLAVYADKTEDRQFILRRGYEHLVRGKSVLIAEDVIVTGGSARKVADAVLANGGRTIGVVALCYRGGVLGMDDPTMHIFQTLVRLDFPRWLPDDCPLCKAGVPLNTDFGKGT